MKYSFILLAGLMVMQAAKGQAAADLLPLYVGTYTQGTGSHGIYIAQFNERLGTLVIRDSLAIENPSYLVVNAKGNRLHAVVENGGEKPGGVQSFGYSRKQKKWLPLMNNPLPTGGDHPCYIDLSADERIAVVANYSGGSLTVFPVGKEKQLLPYNQIIKHKGISANTSRQQSAHVHTAMFGNGGKQVWVADLGTDSIMAYAYDSKHAQSPLQRPASMFMAMEPGAGPRHIALHNSLPVAYIMEELSGKVMVAKYTMGEKALQPLQRVQADNISKQPGSADIHLHPSGKWLFCTNRAEANTISVFAVKADGQLQHVQNVNSGGVMPRNFVITPSGKYLLVAHQRSNSIVVFGIDAATGTLRQVGEAYTLPSPVCLRFGPAR